MQKKVHYSELEDMQKYIPDFNPDDYEESLSSTDPEVQEYARNYYANHLPVDITAWIRVNEPDKDLIYAKGLGDQVCFVRDTIHPLLIPSYDERVKNPTMVISTHVSKSVKLPVYMITLEEYGIEMVLRYNFMWWSVSIKSDLPLCFDSMELFDTSKVIAESMCIGFPSDKIYDCYDHNPSQFTFTLNSNYELYTFIFLLKSYLDKKFIRPIRQNLTVYAIDHQIFVPDVISAQILYVDKKSRTFIALLYSDTQRRYSFDDIGRLIFGTKIEAERYAKILPRHGQLVYRIINNKVYKRLCRGLIGEFVHNNEFSCDIYDLFIVLDAGKNVSTKEIGQTIFFTKEDALKSKK